MQPTRQTPKNRKPADMDTQMLFGCSGFVGSSIGTFLLTVWPHMVYMNITSMRALYIGALLGMLPAAITGAWVTRRFGIAGSAGFIAGSIASAVFLNLRLRQGTMLRGVPQAPQPEYPDVFVWLLPVGWVIVAIVVCLLFIAREEVALDHPSGSKTSEDS